MSAVVAASSAARAAAELDDAAAVFGALRPRLFGIAYRILGSWAEAEDAVQDAWLRWQSCDRAVVLNPTAFLVTTVRRVALTTLRSARLRHESCVLVDDQLRDVGQGPDARGEVVDALDHASGVLLRRLGPAERAAFVLREAFDYPYVDIASLLGTSAVNARQLVSRATRRVAGTGAVARCPGDADHRRLTETLLLATRTGELGPLEQVLLSRAAERS